MDSCASAYGACPAAAYPSAHWRLASTVHRVLLQVLIFSDSSWAVLYRVCFPWLGVPEKAFQDVQAALKELTSPLESKEVPKSWREELIGGEPAFELLDAPADGAHLLRFRLTGREHFKLPRDLDLAQHPYRSSASLP